MLCVILYAAKLVQSAEEVLTKTDLCNLLHKMMESNEGRSSLKQLQKEITSLMLVLSEKYSSECFLDLLVDYPSIFHSICNNSNEFGCSRNQASSSTNDTADSDWQQSEDKFYCTRSSDSASDSCFSLYQNDLSSVSGAKHHSRPKPNFISDVESQDSEYQEETHKNSHKNCDECEKECTKNISLQKSEDKDSECQGVPLLKGQFGALIVRFFHFLKNIHILTHVYV